MWTLWSIGLQKCKGNLYFEVGCGMQHVLVGFKKFSKGLPNLDLTPQKFVRGWLTSGHVNFLKTSRLIVTGWQPMMHPLASIRGIVFLRITPFLLLP
jgi:hypothetical protein